MNIRFHTNLDKAQMFVYYQTNYENRTPWEHVPAIGSRIVFALPIEPKGSTFELEVCSITYSADGQECSVELHIPSYYKTWSIKQWEDWFDRRLGKDY